MSWGWQSDTCSHHVCIFWSSRSRYQQYNFHSHHPQHCYWHVHRMWESADEIKERSSSFKWVVWFCFSRKDGIGGGGWVTRRVQTAWPSLGSALEMPWLALMGHCYPPMHKRVEKTVLSPARCPFPMGKPLSHSGRAGAGWVPWLLPAHGGCGLSHERVEDGCKSTCAKFGGWKPDRTGDMVTHKWPKGQEVTFGLYLNSCIG